jgi:predicted enzyme related to lactoylglutathione lyase
MPALFEQIDCYQLAVSDLDAAIAFYGRLGHEVIWRTPTSAGLRMPDTDAELVVQIERPSPEIDLKVADVDAAVEQFVAAGGRVVHEPFDIAIGRAVVVADPWDNTLVLLDASKGALVTDDDRTVIGVLPRAEEPAAE